jgi:hypothetical protein
MKRILLLALAAFAVHADEGMWTYDNFPSAKVGKLYGFSPDAKWLEEAQLSSVRLAGGCSGSFVSPDGLVMTNHHCAHKCIEHLSTKEKDFVKEGFYAPALANEVKCPEIELNELLSITDVTARINAATKGLDGQAYNERQKAEMSAIEKECSNGDDKLRCDVVTLYHGGIYDLYRYKRFQDVRLVFAPEFAIAFFGGDPDNFNFPRYDLDVSFLRAYENDKPARTEHYFKWSPNGAREGDLTFVSGNPGGTDRDLTMAELQYQRDVALPERLFDLAEYRGNVTEFTRISPEHYRIGEADLFHVENSFKAIKGRYEALVSPEVWNAKVEREKALRAKVNGKAALKKQYGAGWEKVARALDEFRPRRKEYRFIEEGAGFKSRLYAFARTLVRGTEELQKPNEKRLREYRDSALPSLRQSLFSKAPIYDELEVFKLTYGLTKLREELGADHPFVKKVLGKRSPAELAGELVAGTKLKDPQLRRQLWQDGKGRDAVLAQQDAMIELVKLTDPDARAIRKWHDDVVESAEKKGSEMIARARFDLEGTSAYPDATFSLRLSYGQVKGWEEKGRHVDPLTHFAGGFERATGRDPFKLPESWLRANENKQINLATPLDFCSTNDIIGGNSGSPVFDKDRQIVGLIFDGNIESLGGEYYFDERVNRAVAVHSAALIEALDHIYGAKRIVGELLGRSGSGGP